MTEEQYNLATPIIEKIKKLRKHKESIELNVNNEPLSVAGIILKHEIISFNKQAYLQALDDMINDELNNLANI